MTTLRLVLAAILASAAPAIASPWSEGVPETTQDQANAIFEEGNALFAQQAHAPALAKYRAAIALWDHPLIRFNLAVTLIRLDRPLEAADHLEAALRFGAAPFKPELYQQALDYQALLKGRVGYVEARCPQTGVKVRLDGKPWFDCPATQKVRVLTGEHTVDGEREGYVPATSGRVVVSGGAVATHDVTMRSLESAVAVTYKYPRWIPFTTLGAGIAIGLGGVAVWLAGRSQMNDFEDQYLVECPVGCQKDLNEKPALRDQRDRAALEGKIGIGMMIGGGAIAVGGLVLTLINTGTRELPRFDVGPTDGGMTASTTFRF